MVPFKTICLVCAQYKKNCAIQKDLVADNEWSPYKCRCDIFVTWAPLSSLLLTCLFCGRHRTEIEQISLLPINRPPTVKDAAIGAINLIPPPPPSMMTAIAAVVEHHRRCHSVDGDDRQKPSVVVCRRWWDWRSLSMEAAVDGVRGNGGLCRWQLSSM
jgi:hypothetical protein